MRIEFTWLSGLLLAVIAQALFAAGLLAGAHRNQPANRFLALLMVAIAGWVTDAFLRVSGIYGQNPNWYFAPIYYSLAFGPLLYCYVRALTDHTWRWRPADWWHFAPVAAQAALYWVLRFESYETRNWFWQHVHRPVTYRLEFGGTWVSLLAYLLLSLRWLRRYERGLLDRFSDVSRLRLTWLRTLLVVVAVVSAQWFAELVLREGFDVYYQYDYSAELLGLTLLLIGVAGLRQADLVELDRDPVPVAAPTEAGVEETMPLIAAEPERPAVDEAQLARVRRALEEDGLYRNPALTLAELAAHVQLNPKVVSYLINAGTGQTFHELVNGLRVADVQRRLADPAELQRLTLLGIALDCGFNSKTTFNRIFKELTGVAPSEYVRQQGPTDALGRPTADLGR